MEFQPPPRTYATVDPFKPSISYSVGQIHRSHRAPPDDTDLHSPPHQAASHSRHHTGAIQPSTDAAVGRRFEASPDSSIPTASSNIGLPARHRICVPRFEPPTDNQILWPIPLPHELSRDQHLDFQSRPHSRSPSPSNRWTHGPPTPPLVLPSSPPQPPSPSRNFDSRSRHRSRSPSSSERSRERSRSPRRRRSRSRSRTPIHLRGRSTSRSDDRLPPAVVVSPLSAPEPPIPSSMASPIAIRPSPLRSRSGSRRSRSERSRSRTPPIMPDHSPEFISFELPQSQRSSGSPTPYLHVISQNLRNPIVIQRPPHDLGSSSAHPLSLVHEKTESSTSASSRRSAVNSPSASSDEKRPVGFWDSSETVHLLTCVAAFVFDTLPRQIYLHFLLRLPYMYFSRVARIFQEAEATLVQIKEGILSAAIQLKEPVKTFADAWKLEPVESVEYSKLRKTWQSFIDSLIKEWETLNIISVLLLS